jgi:processive 1,2-diacylglycerol beta-glucosyltransferase
MLYTPSKRILIVSSNTGGGHQSAAGALQESFLRLSPGQVLVNVVQALEDAHVITRRFADLYNYLLRNHQHYMRYYYSAIEKLRPYESHMLFQMCMRYGMQVVERLAPTTLVSVHPMTQHFFVHILKKLRLLDKIPLITVVTDPCAGFWKGWACPEVSRYFVASDDARGQLVEYGIPEERIQVSGMPIHAKFQPMNEPMNRRQLREDLNLDPDRFTVLINAGWIGGGNVPDLYNSLMEAGNRNIQVVFLAGHNTDLRDKAERLSGQAGFPVKVMGFTPDVDQLMNASDVMVSKLGGLTTFEAMACHLPILADCLTPPMPQEEGTARYIQAKGAGVLITNTQQVMAEIDAMMHSPDRYCQMKEAAAGIGRPGATDVIASEILKYHA